MIAKVVKPIVVANLADTAVKETPILYNVLKGLTSLQGLNIKLQDLTFGKIPGVGEAFKFLRDKLMDAQEFIFGAITPTFTEAQKNARNWNDPKFYEHYPKYMKGVTINSDYPNTYYSNLIDQDNVVRDTGQVPSVLHIQTILGMPHDIESARNRFNTMYAVVKAARGLSSTTYDYKHVQDYFIATTALQLLHSYLNKALSIVTAADPAKPRIPSSILAGMDIDYEEITNNLAEYLEFHTYMVGVINTSGIVTWGHLSDKIRSSEYFLKDSNQKVGTYYNTNYLLAEYFYTDEAKHITSISYHVNEHGLGSTKLNLQSFRNIFNTWLRVYDSNKSMSDFKADILGCLGNENAINLQIKYDNKLTSAKYDELGLSALKNADTDAAGEIFYNNATRSYDQILSYTDLSNDTYGFVATLHAATDGPVTQVTLAGTPFLKYSQFATALAIPAQIKTNRTAVAVHKDSIANGEASEVLSRRIMALNIVTRKLGDITYVSREFRPVNDLIVGLIFDQSNDDSNYSANNYGYLNPSPVHSPEYDSLRAMYWSLLDWAPAVVLSSRTGTSGNYAYVSLWDMDNIGSVSFFTLNKVSNLIDYSMLDPDIKVTGEKGKQIQNLIDLYTSK